MNVLAKKTRVKVPAEVLIKVGIETFAAGLKTAVIYYGRWAKGKRKKKEEPIIFTDEG